MQAFATIIVLSLASFAAGAVTPAPRDIPAGGYGTPGLIHCKTDDCSGTYDVNNSGFGDCLFLPYDQSLPPYGDSPCLGTSVFRSVINYAPKNITSLPFDIYVEQFGQNFSKCGNTASETAVKLEKLNTCYKLTDASQEFQYELLFGVGF